MLHYHFHTGKPVTFKQFSRKPYAVFSSLRREIRIGVVSLATLAYANTGSMAASPVSMFPNSDTSRTHLLAPVEVVADRSSLTTEKAARMVKVITREEISRIEAQSVVDLLKQAACVDVRQRGGFGVQSDISVNGGTFDQITLLLNGVNIANPQTGHLTADFPVNRDDIERIEILEGTDRHLSGSAVFSGAVNIVTRQEYSDNLGARIEGGSFGTAGGGGYLNAGNDAGFHRLSGSYRRSDGGTSNSDFKQGKIFYNGRYRNGNLRLDWQGGYGKQAYGANTFYSATYPDQWEETGRLFLSVKAESRHGNFHLSPSASWIRSTDHFQFTRHSSSGENFHRNDVLTAGMEGRTQWRAGRTTAGMELRYENILSTNLGKPLDESRYVRIHGEKGTYYDKRDKRTNLNLFLEHHLSGRNWAASAGVLVNRNSRTGETFRWYPGADISFRPGAGWTLYASWHKAYRLPTFTDLYYKSPTQEGNMSLKSEKISSFRTGTQWKNRWISASASVFHTHGSDMIDWVMYTADDIYHSANFQLDNYGFTGSASADLNRLAGSRNPLRQISVSYAYIHQKRHDDRIIYKSNYALEYLRHKFTISLDHRIWNKLGATWSFRWQERMGAYLFYPDRASTGRAMPYRPYGVLNCRLRWTTPQSSFYVSFDNLTSHTYYDQGNVRQPGLWIMAGASFSLR